MATVKIGRASDREVKPTMKAKESWYLDAQGNPTTDVEKAASHIAEKGQDILPHIATKYGFENGTIAPKAIKQSAADAEAAEKEAAKERKAAEKAAAKGIVEAPDQLSAADQAAEVKGQAPTENKAAKK
jgi:hypothetical protein